MFSRKDNLYIKVKSIRKIEDQMEPYQKARKVISRGMGNNAWIEIEQKNMNEEGRLSVGNRYLDVSWEN